MKTLSLTNGSSKYGACMGRRNAIPSDYNGEALRLQRVPMVDYGAYDRWGAYWGQGTPLWIAWGESETEQVQVFVRSETRSGAKARVIETIQQSTFNSSLPVNFIR